jgi:hypothetical protein
MSTRSMIAIQDADGACYAIYCHFDGYVSHMGKMLTTYFNDDENAADLINNGELRSLDISAEDENVIVREHFEEDFEKREIEYYDTVVDMLNAFQNSDREYIYLWDDVIETWLYRKNIYTNNGKMVEPEWKPVLSALISGE